MNDTSNTTDPDDITMAATLFNYLVAEQGSVQEALLEARRRLGKGLYADQADDAPNDLREACLEIIRKEGI